MALRNLKETINRILQKKEAFSVLDGVNPETVKPFTSKQEITFIMNSEHWCNPTNLARLTATFPVLDHMLVTMNEQDYMKMVQYVNSFGVSEHNCSDRLIGLFSSIKQNCYLNIENNLFRLGFSSREVRDISDITDAIRVHDSLDSQSLHQACFRHQDKFETIMNYANYRDQLFFNGQHAREIQELKTNTAFLFELSNLGLNPVTVGDNAGKTFVTHIPNRSEIPREGIKLHISASDKTDYIHLLENIVPDLIRCGATFKVLNLSKFDKLYDNPIQAGKAITIYQTPSFNAREFFALHPELTQSDPAHVIAGDKSLGGRVYGRYGSFIANTPLTDPRTGMQFTDDRTKSVPDYIADITLDDFIDCCEGCAFGNFVPCKDLYTWDHEGNLIVKDVIGPDGIESIEIDDGFER